MTDLEANEFVINLAGQLKQIMHISVKTSTGSDNHLSQYTLLGHVLGTINHA